MDTEGNECNILDGAYSVIDRSPKMKIMMEWNTGMLNLAGGISPKDCLQKLVDRGYDMYIIQDYNVLKTDIEGLTNNNDHFDIFLKKPLMPTEDLGPSSTHQKTDL